LESATGIELEARWDGPERPTVAAVFCHPHPQQGGTMTAPLMEKVTSVLVDRDIAVLRFNFRGVGTSAGTWDGGVGEVDDVAAAVDAAAQAYPALPLGIAGWSFGAATSLRWAARDNSTLPWVGLAPPPPTRDGERHLPLAAELSDAARLFILGNRDQFATVDAMERYTAEAGGTLHVIKGSDHFFYFREDTVGTLTADVLAGVSRPNRPDG